ncbi:MAG TPA: glycosyltransferase [Bacteroidia bacterium]|nr:glycosyltransferase [Bacteroidia bacterium]
MKTILVSTYAVNPFKGSEDGMGWNFICQIARYNKVISITRKNNKEDIERYMLEQPNGIHANIRFLYYDLPYWMRFWKKGSRGALIYYYLWQFFMPIFIMRQKIKFDIVHNLNFHNDWTPSFLWATNKPFVWGPIGHHPQIPDRYIRQQYGFRQRCIEKIRWATKKIFWNADPFLWLTVKNADAVLVMNSDVKNQINIHKKKTLIMPSVGSELMTINKEKRNTYKILSAGRFVALKGFDLTLLSFSKFYHSLDTSEQQYVSLTLIGSGPELDTINKIIQDENISNAVQIIAWIERKEMLRHYAQSDVFLFPSHEGAGMVVSEALSCGMPVVCLNNSGPGEFIDSSCGIAVDMESYDETICQLADALKQLYYNPSLRNELSHGAVRRHQNYFLWDVKGDQLQKLYEEIDCTK